MSHDFSFLCPISVSRKTVYELRRDNGRDVSQTHPPNQPPRCTYNASMFWGGASPRGVLSSARAGGAERGQRVVDSSRRVQNEKGSRLRFEVSRHVHVLQYALTDSAARGSL